MGWILRSLLLIKHLLFLQAALINEFQHINTWTCPIKERDTLFQTLKSKMDEIQKFEDLFNKKMQLCS